MKHVIPLLFLGAAVYGVAMIAAMLAARQFLPGVGMAALLGIALWIFRDVLRKSLRWLVTGKYGNLR